MPARFRWRNVWWMVGGTAAVALAFVWAPVWAHQARLRDENRIAHLRAAVALDGTGLWACDDRYFDPGRAFGPKQDRADVVVTTMPSFQQAWRMSVSGNVVNIERADLRDGSSSAASAAIDPTQAKRVGKLFARLVAARGTERRLGLDGTTYRIEAGGRCAETWSPPAAWGAGRLVLIAKLMAGQARELPEKDPVAAARALDILLGSFEHGDGSELIDYRLQARTPLEDLGYQLPPLDR